MAVILSNFPNLNNQEMLKYLFYNLIIGNMSFSAFPKITDVSKKIEVLAKKKGCSILGSWKQSISNHLYWCAASSGGDGKEVEAKWLSITNHVVNVHEGHSSTFPPCAHGPLEEERQWLKKGTFI